MSAETEQAIHDAIAAHIADVNEGDVEFLTEWAVVAASAVSTNVHATGYYYVDSGLAHHHALGLIDWGKTHIAESRMMSMIGDCEDDEDG